MNTSTIEQRAKMCFPERVVQYPTDDIPYNKYMSNRRLGYIKGATEQHNIDINNLKSVLNALMIDTHDKAEILKAMQQL